MSSTDRAAFSRRHRQECLCYQNLTAHPHHVHRNFFASASHHLRHLAHAARSLHVPPGMSPDCADVEFFPGGVRTRPGLVSQFAPLAGTPNVNALKTYITTNLVQRLLVLDSLGTIYKETSPGTLGVLIAGLQPNLLFASTTHFGREYMAFSDGLVGADLPRQFDDTFFDRVSQVGPGEAPAPADSTLTGNISAGVHECVVMFVTRQGFWTAPSPITNWTAAGSKQVTVTNIPTGPANVVQRLLAFTAEGGASFFHVPDSMVIDDNTTTSLTVDFSDTILLAGVSMDYLFAQIELPDQLGVIDYAERLFWWGERSKMSLFNNLSFDGGWGLATGFLRAGDGAPLIRGLISQSAATDTAGDPLCVKGVDYSVRARVKHSGGLTAGTLHVNAFSPSMGLIGTGLSVAASAATTGYQEFIADLFPPQASLPADLVLRVYADGTPGPSGESFLVDCIEVFPTAAAQNSSLVRASGTGEPEAYDGVSGIME